MTRVDPSADLKALTAEQADLAQERLLAAWLQERGKCPSDLPKVPSDLPVSDKTS